MAISLSHPFLVYHWTSTKSNVNISFCWSQKDVLEVDPCSRSEARGKDQKKKYEQKANETRANEQE